MKKHLVGLCLLLGFAFPFFANGQGLTFCLDHTPSGLPLGSGKTFELERHGQDVEMLYRANSPIREERIYYFIDYEQDGKFVEFDAKSVEPDHNKNWISTPYRFQRTGHYRVLMLDANKKEICRGELDVNVKEETNTPEYYLGSKLIFCNSATNGKPDTSYAAIRVSSGQAETLAVFIRHIRPLKTRHIYVDVWVGSGETAGMYLETFEFTIEPNWTFSQFPYEFRGAGVYTFRIYNENEIWMTSGQIEVTTQ